METIGEHTKLITINHAILFPNSIHFFLFGVLSPYVRTFFVYFVYIY